MKKLIVILFTITTINIGCNKTKQTMEKIYGDYTVKKYAVNGIDSTSLCLDSVGSSFNFYFSEPSENNVLCIEGTSNYNNHGLFFIIVWELSENDKMIKIKSIQTNNIGTGPFGSGKISEWAIQALTKNKFHIMTNYNGKEYFIELE